MLIFFLLLLLFFPLLLLMLQLMLLFLLLFPFLNPRIFCHIFCWPKNDQHLAQVILTISIFFTLAVNHCLHNRPLFRAVLRRRHGPGLAPPLLRIRNHRQLNGAHRARQRRLLVRKDKDSPCSSPASYVFFHKKTVATYNDWCIMIPHAKSWGALFTKCSVN